MTTQLSATLLILLAITLNLLSHDPFFMMRFAAWLKPAPVMAPDQDIIEVIKHDPIVGTAFPEGAAADAVKAASGNKARLHMVIPVGSCAVCLKANLKEWEDDAHKAGVSFALVSYGEKAAFSEFRSSIRVVSPIIPDPGQQLHQQMNVAWVGRPYIYDANWRLIWLPHDIRAMQNPFDDPQVKTILSGGKQ